MRLLGWDPVRWQNRAHFFGVSARMMRRVLVDIARRRLAERRGGPDAIRVPLDSIDVPAREPGDDLIAVDMALEELARSDPRKAEVVELRFFGGLSVEETAAALRVSERTVRSDWAFARPFSLGRLLMGAGRADLGSNLTEPKLGLVFATIGAAAGWTRFRSRICVSGFILVRGRR